MSFRSLFITVIRIIGLYLLIQTLYSVLPFFLALSDMDSLNLMGAFLVLILTIGLLSLLLYRADRVADLLRLDKGFDEKQVNLGSLDSKRSLTIALIVIGAMLVLDHVPSLIYFGYQSLETAARPSPDYEIPTEQWLIPVISIVIGVVLMAYADKVSAFLNRKNEVA